MAKSVEKILGAYSKEVIIEWITNRYPVFMNKDLEKELEDVKNDLEFNKATKELDTLFKKQKELREKPFTVTVATEMEKNRKRIKCLLGKQEKFIGLNQEIKENDR